MALPLALCLYQKETGMDKELMNQYAFDNAMMLQDSCMPDAPVVTDSLLRESEENEHEP